MAHPAFNATVEGTWSFENEELSQTRFTRTGDPETIESAVDAMIEAIDGEGMDDDEFTDFLQTLEDDDDDEVPLIGDDPTEPPDAHRARPQPPEGDRQAGRPQSRYPRSASKTAAGWSRRRNCCRWSPSR